MTKSVEIEGISTEHIALRDQIISTLPAETVIPIFIAICGSQAKGLASPTSDFDMKMIVLHSKTYYLLQKSTASTRLKTEYNSIEVEGTIMDALPATTNYLPKSNPMIYECMAGIPIYKTVYSEKLNQLWQKSYNWEIIRHATHGILTGYKHKKLFLDK